MKTKRTEKNGNEVKLVPDPVNPEKWIPAEELAKRFRKLVKRTGLKQIAIADLCGVSDDTISNYCHGRTSVPRAVWRLVESRALQ